MLFMKNIYNLQYPTQFQRMLLLNQLVRQYPKMNLQDLALDLKHLKSFQKLDYRCHICLVYLIM